MARTGRGLLHILVIAAAFVFLAIVAGVALTSILLRNHLRNRYKW